MSPTVVPAVGTTVGSVEAPLAVENVLVRREFLEPRPHPVEPWRLAVVEVLDREARLGELNLRTGSIRTVSTRLLRSSRTLWGGVHDWLAGGHVAVTAEGELLLIDEVGERSVAGPGGRPVSSPAPGDGAVLVIVDQAEVWRLDVAREEWTRVDRGAHEFVADPVWWRGSPLWVGWNPPHMPWDETHLVTPSGVLTAVPERQVQQPRTWGDRLGWIDDAGGWLNVVLHDGRRVAEPFEHAMPSWGERQRSWCVSPDGAHVAFARNERGFGRLCTVDLATGTVTDRAKAVHGQLSWTPEGLYAVRTGGRTPPQIVRYDTANPKSDGSWPRTTLLVGPEFDFDDHPALVEPELIDAVADDGTVIPARLYRAPEAHGGLLCWVHGGPTDQWTVSFEPRFAWWLDRGWSILVPDHRGSTGHGRAFTVAMRGEWGRLDVDDVAATVAHVQRTHDFEPAATAVLGGSAGGLTALGVAASHSALLAAVVAAYPVTDIAALDHVTHRFEAHYNRTLMGDVDETRRKSLERSPLHRAERLVALPLLLLHGDIDPVVPVDQSRRLAEAVRTAGGEVELVVYEGEGHGFRRPENKRDEYLRTEAFLVRHLSRRGIASPT